MPKYEAVKEIVKVQLSIYTSVGPQRILIYAQDRKRTTEREATTQDKALMGTSVKRYFYATWKHRDWVLDKIAPNQSW